MCYCQFLLLCLLVLILCIEVLLCWVHRYLQLLCLPLDHYVVPFLTSCNRLYFKDYCVWYEDCYSSFLLLPIYMEYWNIFSTLSLSVYMCLEIWGAFLVDILYMGVVFLSIQPVCVFWLKHLNHLHLKYLLISMFLLPFYNCLGLNL